MKSYSAADARPNQLQMSPTGSLPPAVPLAITPTFRRWTHTSDDSYMCQLSLVVATATVSSSPFFSLSFLLVYLRSGVTEQALLILPVPTTVRALHFYLEMTSFGCFFPRRLASNSATPLLTYKNYPIR